MTNYISGNPIPEEDDIAEWLDTILNTEFELILEDDSIYVSSRGFFLAATDFKKGNIQALETLWNQIPEKQKVNAKAIPNEFDSEEDDGSSEEDEPMDEDDNQGDTKNRRSKIHNVPDEDGWVTVQRR